MAPAAALAAVACQPGIVDIAAAPQGGDAAAPPESGWVAVTLPDTWGQRWPEHNSVWYRLQWRNECAAGQPIALAVDRITMAGGIYLNDSLLWRDASLSEPFSRSWNMPRYWLLPEAGLAAGDNTLWVQVRGMRHDTLGLGNVWLGPPDTVRPLYDAARWYQRDLFILNAVMSLALGAMFLTLWALRRKETAFGWYALACLVWSAFAGTMLATTPWPFADSSDWNRAVGLLVLIYSIAFCLFTWRFSGRQFPRLSRILQAAALALAAGIWWVPDERLSGVLMVMIPASALLFLVNCAFFQFHAWRHPQRYNVLLAMCLLLFLLVGLRDLLVVLSVLDGEHLMAPVTSPIAMFFMFLIIADRFAANLRRIEGFNEELSAAVERTRSELASTMQGKLELETSNIRLNERLQLSRDLHDSLGSSLVRSIAAVEQSDSPLDNRRFLSMLKELRDDLRQIIDSSSPASHTASATPIEWIAPLRRRFVRFFEEVGIASTWRVPSAWPCRLTAMQQHALVRFLEEALTNVIKHSQADAIEVAMDSSRDGGLLLYVEDNGIGFEAKAAAGGRGVGMRSMASRIARIGGRLDVSPRQGQTRLSVTLDGPRAGVIGSIDSPAARCRGA